MFPIPDWAPGLHPLVIHFPIALLVSAVAVDLASLVFRSRDAIRTVATAMFFAGGAAALVAFLTGQDSADGQSIAPLLTPYVTDHADWAFYTMWFFVIYGVVRMAAHLAEHVRGAGWPSHTAARLTFTIVGAMGMFLLFQTGDRGARLVFEHGIGVGPMSETRAELDSALGRLRALEDRSAEEQFSVAENGSWSWMPTIGADKVLEERFEKLPSEAEYVLSIEEGGSVLLRPDAPILFYVAGEMGDVSVDADLDLSDFVGVVRLIHHGISAESYDFLELADGTLTLGRIRNGTRSEFGDTPFTGNAVFTVVGDGTHFRGYVDGEMVTHGHGDAPEEGWTGLFASGTGSIGVNRLSATALR